MQSPKSFLFRHDYYCKIVTLTITNALFIYRKSFKVLKTEKCVWAYPTYPNTFQPKTKALTTSKQLSKMGTWKTLSTTIPDEHQVAADNFHR
ncbi:hypothetical protein Hanom_Chr08g00739881 [Helianthus anomalus]